MKRFYICVLMFVAGTFYAHSQDMIILRNGNVIEANVLEISSSEIRYIRFDNLDGPVIIIPADNVLSIRYENGIVQTIDTEDKEDTENTEKSSRIDSQKTHFAISADPSGFALFGPSIAAEITKGKFNTQINLRFPSLGLASSGGFGMGVSLNYFHHTQIGGFYIGGLFDYSTNEKNIAGWERNWVDGHWAGGGSYNGDYWTGDEYYVDGQWVDGDWVISKQSVHYITLAINAGYKFILSSGMYFRVGGYLGFQFSKYDSNFLARPELSFGYYF